MSDVERELAERERAEKAERLLREIDEDPRASHLGLYAGGVRMALAALTGETKS